MRASCGDGVKSGSGRSGIKSLALGVLHGVGFMGNPCLLMGTPWRGVFFSFSSSVCTTGGTFAWSQPLTGLKPSSRHSWRLQARRSLWPQKGDALFCFVFYL